MTIALVLAGQMRTYECEQIINSYKKYIYDKENIDLYIFTWDILGYSNNHGNKNIHKNSNTILTKEDILNYYKKFNFLNIKYINVENFNNFLKNLDYSYYKIYNTSFRNHSNVSTFIPIQYKYQQSIRYLNGIDCLKEYSNLIITRPDICFIDYLPVIDTKIDNIYYNCICTTCMDHCWYGKPETIIKQLFNIFDNILINYKNIENYNDNNKDNNIILYHQCFINNISINVDKKHMVKIIYF
jgi:hypothetical protein